MRPAEAAAPAETPGGKPIARIAEDAEDRPRRAEKERPRFPLLRVKAGVPQPHHPPQQVSWTLPPQYGSNRSPSLAPGDPMLMPIPKPHPSLFAALLLAPAIATAQTATRMRVLQEQPVTKTLEAVPVTPPPVGPP